jgi:hypothetical protein
VERRLGGALSPTSAGVMLVCSVDVDASGGGGRGLLEKDLLETALLVKLAFAGGGSEPERAPTA